ncbi:rCG62890 [Rattus norvegicus]|uniref:RCG62890 n=1 Tax=Rattus norvegicus TaxID=10116 RepID=A6JWI3_RAT|nr:rCG62890 [Rattus norvegicus]
MLVAETHELAHTWVTTFEGR